MKKQVKEIYESTKSYVAVGSAVNEMIDMATKIETEQHKSLVTSKSIDFLTDQIKNPTGNALGNIIQGEANPVIGGFIGTIAEALGSIFFSLFSE